MKKLFALILAIALMATMSVTAFATDYDTTGEKGMTVTYSVAPTYIVTIPETVTIGAAGTDKTVSAENVVVEKGQYVSVSLASDNNFTVRTPQGAELTYTVTANSQIVSVGDEILAVNPADGKTGSTTISFDIDEAAIKYAGTYTGTATFTVAVKNVPVTIINFTIDGTSYQAEEGMTWAQWVLSDYNNGGFALDSYDGPMVWSGHNAVCCPGAANAWTDFIDSATEIKSGLAYTLLLLAG